MFTQQSPEGKLAFCMLHSLVQNPAPRGQDTHISLYPHGPGLGTVRNFEMYSAGN